MNETTLREAPLQFFSALQKSSDERKFDTLNLIPYAEALRDFIHECETPMTIGIQGDWCKVVNFETWSYSQFNQDEYLAVACLYALTNKVGVALASEKSTKGPELTAKLNNAKRRLGNVLRNVSVNVAGVSVDVGDAFKDEDKPQIEYEDISEQMIAFRREFAELVHLWVSGDEKKRVVIFVDDLDRIRPIKALELLEAIKNFIDVPGCVFVLAVDYEVVQTGMIEKLGRDLQKTSGKSFFDKIIQLPFTMPTNSYKLDEYIMGLLDRANFPYISKLSKEASSREFFQEITLCTVGRNPRSIKRVMNYANLLERIRKNHAGRSTTSKDSKILYALICMQIAWPELFSHFINDPTVETITNLESWDYLDNLPEARKLFERVPDEERVKNDISTFFDTLFSLLDENEDGQIDSEELAPVLEVMSLAKMTAIEAKERPRDFFVKQVRANNPGRDRDVDHFLNEIYMKSIWFLGTEIKYRKSGSRYLTMIFNRKQIGSLVSLKKQPFVFRLVMSPEEIISSFDADWLEKHHIQDESITFVRNLFGHEASLTGFGDTLIDFTKMSGLPDQEAVRFMNKLFSIVTSQSASGGR